MSNTLHRKWIPTILCTSNTDDMACASLWNAGKCILASFSYTAACSTRSLAAAHFCFLFKQDPVPCTTCSVGSMMHSVLSCLASLAFGLKL